MWRRGQGACALLQFLQVCSEAVGSSVVTHERQRCDFVHVKFKTHHDGELVLQRKISALSLNDKSAGAAAAHLQLRPAAGSGEVVLAQGGSQAAQLQVHAAAREHQKLGVSLNRPEQHEDVVVCAEARQSRRLWMLSSVADIGGENAGDRLVKEGVRNALSHRVAEVQHLALPTAQRDMALAVL